MNKNKQPEYTFEGTIAEFIGDKIDLIHGYRIVWGEEQRVELVYENGYFITQTPIHLNTIKDLKTFIRLFAGRIE